MTDTKISALTALTGADLAAGDLDVVVDVSDTTMAASGTDKKITQAEKAVGLARLGGFPRVYKFDFAYNTPNIGDSSDSYTHAPVIFTPAVGDVLLDLWMVMGTIFNGSTTGLYIGTAADLNAGVDITDTFNAFDPTVADTAAQLAFANDGYTSFSGLMVANASGRRVVPATFTATDPLRIWTGATGSTQGAGSIYLSVASPIQL